jgi:uncharacterized protein (DUF433 family)
MPGEADSREDVLASFHLEPDDIKAAMYFAADTAEDLFLPLER